MPPATPVNAVISHPSSSARLPTRRHQCQPRSQTCTVQMPAALLNTPADTPATSTRDSVNIVLIMTASTPTHLRTADACHPREHAGPCQAKQNHSARKGFGGVVQSASGLAGSGGSMPTQVGRKTTQLVCAHLCSVLICVCHIQYSLCVLTCVECLFVYVTYTYSMSVCVCACAQVRLTHSRIRNEAEEEKTASGQPLNHSSAVEGSMCENVCAYTMYTQQRECVCIAFACPPAGLHRFQLIYLIHLIYLFCFRF